MHVRFVRKKNVKLQVFYESPNSNPANAVLPRPLAKSIAKVTNRPVQAARRVSPFVKRALPRNPKACAFHCLHLFAVAAFTGLNLPSFPWQGIASCAPLLDVLWGVDTSTQAMASKQPTASIDWFAWPSSLSLSTGKSAIWLPDHSRGSRQRLAPTHHEEAKLVAQFLVTSFVHADLTWHHT